MGSQDQLQLSLRWNHHQVNLLSVFDQLLQDESFVDVTIACDGLSLKAHKVVLSASSPYFQKLLLENPCPHPIVILDNVHYADLKALIEFMYKGEVSVFQHQLSTILKTADTLKIKGLSEVTVFNSGEVVLDAMTATSNEQQQPTDLTPTSYSSSSNAKQRRLHQSKRNSGTGGSASDKEGAAAEEGSDTKGGPDDTTSILREEGSSSRRNSSASSLHVKVDQQTSETNVDDKPEPRVHEGFGQDNVKPQHSTLEAANDLLIIRQPISPLHSPFSSSSPFTNNEQKAPSPLSTSPQQQQSPYHSTLSLPPSILSQSSPHLTQECSTIKPTHSLNTTEHSPTDDHQKHKVTTVSKKGSTLSIMTDKIRIALCKHKSMNPRISQSKLQYWLKTQYDIKVSQPTISQTLKRSAQLLKLDNGSNVNKKRQRTVKYPLMENALEEWFHAHQDCMTIDGNLIREHAAKILDRLYPGHPPFEFSNGWLESFKLRHSIHS